MHCLSSVYSVTTPLHVSGLLLAHHQEVTMYICDNRYVLYVIVDCQLYHTSIYNRLPEDEPSGLKHVEDIKS
jgi:hypothetical protein